MHDALVKLPWLSKKEVTHCHGSDVTLNRVLIRAYLEGDLDLLVNLDVAIVT